MIVGTGLRELRSVELKWRDGADFDLSGLHFGPALRKRFGAAQTYTVSNACSASLHALAMGSDLLAAGVTDTVVVAGVDTLTERCSGCSTGCSGAPGSCAALRPGAAGHPHGRRRGGRGAHAGGPQRRAHREGMAGGGCW